MITFTDGFDVEASPAAVMAMFLDIERMVACVPGASLEGKNSDGSYKGSITVTFGPKKIKFSGAFNCIFDTAERAGTLTGIGSAAMRSANVTMTAKFRIEERPLDEANPSDRCHVIFHSEAVFGGVLGEFARVGGEKITRSLMKDFAGNLAGEIAGAKQPASGEPVSESRR